VRGFPCQICGAEDGTIVASHSNQIRDGKGTGIKCHDFRIASLCHKCHQEIDNGKKFNREQKRDYWEEAHRKTVGLLFLNGYIDVK
jgi:hypothetical protein